MKRRVLWRENYTSIKLPRFRKKKMRLPEGTGQRVPRAGRRVKRPKPTAAGVRRDRGAPRRGHLSARPGTSHTCVEAAGRWSRTPGGPRAWPRSGGSTGGRHGGFLPAPETRRLAHPASRELSTRLPVSPLEFLEQKYLLNPLSKCQAGKNKKEKAKEGVSPATKSPSFATPQTPCCPSDTEDIFISPLSPECLGHRVKFWSRAFIVRKESGAQAAPLPVCSTDPPPNATPEGLKGAPVLPDAGSSPSTHFPRPVYSEGFLNGGK